jgi:hypothetical protein
MLLVLLTHLRGLQLGDVRIVVGRLENAVGCVVN